MSIHEWRFGPCYACGQVSVVVCKGKLVCDKCGTINEGCCEGAPPKPAKKKRAKEEVKTKKQPSNIACFRGGPLDGTAEVLDCYYPMRIERIADEDGKVVEHTYRWRQVFQGHGLQIVIGEYEKPARKRK